MQNVSSSYLLEIKKPSRSFECKVTIRDNIYTNADIINITIEDVQPSDGFSIGSAVSKSLELTLSTNNTIYSNSIVKVEIGLNVGSKIEYVLMGYFNIDDIEKTDYSIKLTCFDNMMKFEKPYFSNLGKTASLKNIVNELSQITGVEFTGSLPSYNLNKLEGFTCREILGFVASLCAGNAYITRDGKFTINTLKTIDYSITDENYIDLKTEEDIYKIGAATCKVNEKELTKGTLSNSSMEVAFENPWVNDSILTDIYNKLKSIEYVGYSMKWQGDLSLDVGDIISLTDHKGVKRNIPILSQKFNYNGGLTSEIGAKGESKNKNEFNSTGNLSNKVNRVVTELLIVNEALINKADIEELKAVNATIENLIAENVTITGKLTAIEGEFGTLKSNVGVIDKLTVTHTAQINALEANKASITQLEAVSAKIGTVEAEVGKIQTLINGNLSSENIQAGGITSDKLTIANGFITNAMIANLDVSKINAGDISTNKFRIKSDDGGIEIVGATQQFKDKNNKVRVQIGRDKNNNFTFSLFDETGTGVLIDHTGIKEGAIADDLIISDMIASDAVGEKQINYSSFITGFNKDTNTSTIKSTKIMLNNQNQTLDIAFNQLKTQADATKSLTESHSTTIGVMQGQITTAINNTQIVKDGQTILLKDDYNRTVQTVNSMNSTIGSHTTKINEHTGKITGVETRVNTVERDLDGITARVSSTEKNVTTVTNTANAANANATDALNKANSANSKIDGLEIGGRNIVKDTGTPKSIASTGATNITGAHYNLTVPYLTDIKDKELIVVFDWKYEGENPSGTFYMQTGEPQYGTVTSRESISPTNTSGTIKKIWKPTMEKDTKIVYMRTDNMVGTLIISNLRIYFGTMDIGWTPAPEDIQEQIDANKTEISTTKSNMATIETNLSSITSRVSTVENKQTTVDGKVTALETWKKSAEVKITDSAIVSTVTKSTAYKNDLNGKVSYNNIISSINQTSETIKIDASKINLNGYVTMTNLNTPGQTVIDGENIKTNTILAEKIAIGDFTNYVVIPTNSTFTGTSGSTEGYEVCSIKGSEKYNHANISNKLYGINGGDKFRVKAMIKSDTVGSRLDITCCWRNANNEIVSSSTIYGTVSSANTWTEINEIITVPSRPSGASYVRFKINIQAEQYRRIYVERLNITRMYSGELIVDGSITSIKLSADAIDGRTIKGAIIVGGELRGSSNFFTSPDPNSVDGYAFRIYSTGELHSNNLILTSIGNNYSRLESSGVISCSKQVNSPAIITGGQSLWLGIRGVTPGSESNFNFELTQQADKTVYFRPGYNGQAVLGHSAKMFNKVYSVNGVSSSSDRTLKENIKYLSTTANPNCRLATDITELDLYNFVKDDLVTAKFNFIGDDKQHIGFIAQDLLYNADGTDNRIGQIIVNKPDDERSPLSYNEKIYVNVLAGALRHAILKIEEKNDKIINLEKRLEELENKMIV
ncbi:MAG: tail fiber domain-containing protein [Terrisporobacter othiniensis]|uniref:tail fiber domain-containing protein n=1 Tax=Terrisporobacter othiniensis TaxID=1577792 RepID=UPI002911511B|nr:tail fiber domain-containing protein [Terrisporobacter othiniensis]MDU6984232.1 tail fiber domain-containing protein [Terrisporobacter othiniensis]